MLRTRRVAF